MTTKKTDDPNATEIFTNALIAAGKVFNRDVDTDLVRLYSHLLTPYGLDQCAVVIKGLMLKSRRFPVPAEIIENLSGSKLLSEEAAWNKALSARLYDERLTIVLPMAIVASFPYSIWPDRVAARMAFKEVYQSNLRVYGEEVTISIGQDSAGREPVIQEAIRTGLISQSVGQKYLDHIVSNNTNKFQRLLKAGGRKLPKMNPLMKKWQARPKYF